MSEPLWLKTISNHAVIRKSELFDWMGVTSEELRLLIKNEGFPHPRFGGLRSKPGSERITSSSRWRVGDVRAWLDGSSKLKKELATEIGVEQSPAIRALHARGFSAMGGFKNPGR